MLRRISVFVLSIVCSLSYADVIQMTNGDRISGTVEGISAGKVLIATSYADTIAVSVGEIESVTSEKEFSVRTGGETVRGKFAASENGQVLQSGSGTSPIVLSDVRSASESNLAITQLASEFSNRADIGLVISNGNSDTESLNTLIESVYKRDKVQHAATLLVSSEEADEVQTKDQLDFDYNYKRFMSDRWYLAGNAEYFTDELKDIDSRITVGAGAGYQFWDNTFGAFSAEAGVSAVREDIDGEEEDNPAFRFAIDYKKFLMAKRLELFHRNSVLVIPDSDRGEVIYGSTGLRYAVSDRIDTTARVDLIHETEPAPGNSKTDTTYTLGIGVKF